MIAALIILSFVVGMAMPGTAYVLQLVWVEIKSLFRHRRVMRAMRGPSGFFHN